MVGYMEYRFGKLDKVSVTPSLLYKNGSAGQHQFEENLLLNIKNIVQIGAGYRHEAGLLGRFGININDKVHLAYAYEFATTDLAKVSSGSHEFLIGLKICGKDKMTPVILGIIATPLDALLTHHIFDFLTQYFEKEEVEKVVV